MTELVDPVGQLTAKSFHPRALIDGDNRPLVALSDALDVLARSAERRSARADETDADDWLGIVNGTVFYIVRAGNSVRAIEAIGDEWRRTFTPDTPEESGGEMSDIRVIRWDWVRRIAKRCGGDGQ